MRESDKGESVSQLSKEMKDRDGVSVPGAVEELSLHAKAARENCSKNQPKPHTDLLEEIYQREIERRQIDFEVDDVVIEFAVPVTVFVDAHDARTQAEKPDRCFKTKGP